ncbi:UDP-glycosyltransferase 43 [Lathyrus oleraceus]|uniref:Glycosyltransferase n=1 Tax=Pisum sativum TaxID=3888 RepID=A0A9D5BE45_PEA|nr:UDP-glycosyltransferase 43-like [Pisum sativum]KAI5440931.1 UDP-glycosyltransferase 43 [Pisum sativum]
MTRFELVFISTPTIGNMVPTVEFANNLTNHNPQLSATILIITNPKLPLVNTYLQSRPSSTTNLKFIHLPTVDPPTPDQYQSFIAYICLLIQKHKINIKNALINLTLTASSTESNYDSVKLAAVFIDMFSTTIIDVANEISVPCYLFFASPASFLGFTLHLPRLDNVESEAEFEIPSFENPLPKLVLPNLVLDWKSEEDAYSWVSYHAGRYKETKGIVVNTLQELEPRALCSLYNDLKLPPVYPIGPILDLDGPAQWDPNPVQYNYIKEWLDMQVPGSVVFLCFGSLGSLEVKQVEQIAIGLERAGVRFLWALRGPPKAQLEDPRDYTSYENVLPDGFLKRTVGMGVVCGWVPQAKVLAHKAVGGFVSHCGWNSILESLWYGVPIATWPVYAEQQMNAFEMVRELGLAVEIRLDYRVGSDLVRAEEVENGVSKLMNGSDEVRKKVKEMSEKCRVALTDNGSSYTNLVSLIQELTK